MYKEDEDMYDPVLEELKGISCYLKEIKLLMKKQIKIENMNNVLLRKINKDSMDDKMIEHNVDYYLNKNLLIINDFKMETISFAKKISKKMNSKLIISKAKTDSELASVINGAEENDIVFIDVTDESFDEHMAKIIYDCIKEKCIYVTIGKGVGAREINVEIPGVFFILYTYLEELILIELKELLTIVQ